MILDVFRFYAFEFAHLVFFFMGLTFLLQGALFVALISIRNRLLRHFDHTKTDSLLSRVLELREEASTLKNFLFDYGPITLHIPLREKLEYKIIKGFFIKSYNLPLV
jgi:hypothetical protein